MKKKDSRISSGASLRVRPQSIQPALLPSGMCRVDRTDADQTQRMLITF